MEATGATELKISYSMASRHSQDKAAPGLDPALGARWEASVTSGCKSPTYKEANCGTATMSEGERWREECFERCEIQAAIEPKLDIPKRK